MADGLSLLGVRSARRHDVTAQGKGMKVPWNGCSLVGGVRHQPVAFWPGSVCGTVDQYWSISIPVLMVHIGLAMATIGLETPNLFMGLRKLRHGTGVGAMAEGIFRHRRLGYLMQWTFGGTIIITYVVSDMLFY